jgi:ssDNA-binding Zn-finger/Zn-ribbon topoisomerase 1
LECPKCKVARWVKYGLAKEKKFNYLCRENGCQQKERAKKNHKTLPYWDGVGELKVGMCRSSVDLGLSYKYHSAILYWYECPVCHEQKWKPRNQEGKLCPNCTKKEIAKRRLLLNSKRGCYVGHKDKNGYISIRLNPSDPYFCMARKDHRVFEHKYIMAKHLGRPLERWEVVHHINGIRNDNRIENFELKATQTDHVAFSIIQRQLNELKEENRILKEENLVLKKLVC